VVDQRDWRRRCAGGEQRIQCVTHHRHRDVREVFGWMRHTLMDGRLLSRRRLLWLRARFDIRLVIGSPSRWRRSRGCGPTRARAQTDGRIRVEYWCDVGESVGLGRHQGCGKDGR